MTTKMRDMKPRLRGVLHHTAAWYAAHPTGSLVLDDGTEFSADVVVSAMAD